MEKSISQLTQATTIDNDTLVEVSVTDSSTTSGYGSRKTTVGEVRNEVVLTGAEYDALTTEEKMNGKSYYIKDGATTDGVIQPIIYSDTEREVGVWRDGKPLYQKTVDFGALPNATSKSVAHRITNLDRVVYGISIAKNNNNVTLILPYVNSGSDRVGTYVDNTNINIETNTDVSNYTDTYVTIQYTKTTDTPGSGTWTPSGVPAVHYSTDEQIVGTWIEGSTLYQITNVYQNISVASNNYVTLESAWGMELVHAFGFIEENGNRFALPETSIRIAVSSSGDLECTSKISTWNGDLYVTLQYTKPTTS